MTPLPLVHSSRGTSAPTSRASRRSESGPRADVSRRTRGDHRRRRARIAVCHHLSAIASQSDSRAAVRQPRGGVIDSHSRRAPAMKVRDTRRPPPAALRRGHVLNSCSAYARDVYPSIIPLLRLPYFSIYTLWIIPYVRVKKRNPYRLTYVLSVRLSQPICSESWDWDDPSRKVATRMNFCDPQLCNFYAKVQPWPLEQAARAAIMRRRALLVPVRSRI
ncbi:hypothetical protein EVAR_86502_1 [Eumeta japonica]|uniref:Uncharacterized protein n=1 Tax=Eumeta variegata TaxID=151549 RepID=A0A4C1VML7_EUMVA|nr:hypothetical protein EVAR_86502_1 [Eumeta japonica]